MAEAATARSRWIVPVAGAGCLIALIAAFAGLDASATPDVGLARVISLLLLAGWAPALYLAAAVGLARLFRRWLRDSAEHFALQGALGLGIMLTLSHGLGAFGLLDATAGRVLTLVVMALGLALLLDQFRRMRLRARPRAGVWALAWAPATALLIVAASNPPGSLWGSEGHGYDVLSYHLPLPQEWLAMGRLAPLEHNVYSYLPSYVEAAFYHLAVLRADPPGPTERSLAWGLLADDGNGVIACQFLSVGIALFAAWALCALVRAALASGVGEHAERREPPRTAMLYGAVFLGTPWIVVTGSLAYNDLAVVALGAGALLAAMDDRLRPPVRGALAGALVGFACGAKPTAIFMVAPVVGLALLGFHRPPTGKPGRTRIVAVLFAAALGLLGILPWLVRNWTYSGNPVFPQMTSIFGSGHWSAEQAQRFAAAHRFDGSMLDRIRMLILPDGSDPMGVVHRGLLHPQWFAFFLAVGAALLALGAMRMSERRRSRPAPARGIFPGAPALLAAGLALQVIAWLFLTHVQSRFLIPLAITGVPLIALALTSIAARTWAGVAIAGAALLACLQLIASIGLFASQNSGMPNLFLLLGPGGRTGELWRERAADAGTAAATEITDDPWPELYANYTLAPSARLYLLGESRALYFTVPLVYNTTWDPWPLADEMRAAPGDPAAWVEALRARGITHILASYAEIERLSRSGRGWADPLITVSGTGEFLSAHMRLVRSWPDAGIALYALPREADPGRSGATQP
jgi:hypothetical protein